MTGQARTHVRYARSAVARRHAVELDDEDKALALIDSGLADDIDDAYAQLEDMGELDNGR